MHLVGVLCTAWEEWSAVKRAFRPYRHGVGHDYGLGLVAARRNVQHLHGRWKSGTERLALGSGRVDAASTDTIPENVSILG